MYTRNMPVGFYNRGVYTYVDDYEGGHSSTSAINAGLRSFPGFRIGEAVRDRKNKIRAGLQAGSPYILDAYRIEGSPLSLLALNTRIYIGGEKQWANISQIYQGSMPEMIVGCPHNMSPTAEMEARALSKIYDMIRSRKTHINGMNLLGELRETIHMIKKPGESLIKAAQSLIRTQNNTMRKIQGMKGAMRRDALMKMVAGTTLEINFGWKPFISDIKALAETAAKIVTNHRPAGDRVSYAAQASNAAEGGYPGEYMFDNKFPMFQRWFSKTDCSIRYIVGIATEVEAPLGPLQRCTDLLGFTAENIIPTAYELTPWSWAFDYFSNLGDVIEGSTTDTSAVKWIVKTVRQSTVQRETWKNASPPYIGSAQVMGYVAQTNPFVTHRTTLERSLPGTLGTVPLVFTTPGESWSKMANILSVMEQHRKNFRF